jgi:DNA-binding response OmpR family regulator
MMSDMLQVGDLALDIEHRILYLDGNLSNPIKLSPMESRLLATLMESPGQVVKRSRLMKRVWQTDYLEDTRTLDVHICWLRRKIEEDPSHPRRIITHRQQGYELRV